MSTATPSNVRPAMVTPWIDAICVGGASVVFTAGYLLWRVFRPQSAVHTPAEEIVWANILINWPHFLASYRILYRSGSNVRRHWFVAIVMPAVLTALVVFAVVTADRNPPDLAGLARQSVIDILYPVAVLLLAWHYTGQSWGMTATFAYINGVRFQPAERRAIRSGYYALLVFHLLWVAVEPDHLRLLDVVYPGLAQLTFIVFDNWLWVVLVTFVAGAVAFYSAALRHPNSEMMRSWLPWLATYGWYLLIYLHPDMFFILQIAHALQYLTFPLRVEANVYAAEHASEPVRPVLHTALYYLILVAIGAVVFDGLKLGTAGQDPRGQLSTLVTVAINIHHYFIDGVIWKLRRPAVRQALFGHLQLQNAGR